MVGLPRKIVRISVPRGRPGYQRVVFDSGEVLLVRSEDLEGLHLQPNAAVDASTLEQVRALDASARATGVAYQLLSIRMRSRRELTDRLRRRGFPDSLIDEVLTKLENAGLVDDARFAEAWVMGRIALRPSGAVRLRRELWQKGVAREVVDQTLSAALSPLDEEELAMRVAQARRQRYRTLPPRIAARRLAAVLHRRGFAAGVTASVIRQTLGQSIGTVEE